MLTGTILYIKITNKKIAKNDSTNFEKKTKNEKHLGQLSGEIIIDHYFDSSSLNNTFLVTFKTW
jgi:hypothetical protein